MFGRQRGLRAHECKCATNTKLALQQIHNLHCNKYIKQCKLGNNVKMQQWLCLDTEMHVKTTNCCIPIFTFANGYTYTYTCILSHTLCPTQMHILSFLQMGSKKQIRSQTSHLKTIPPFVYSARKYPPCKLQIVFFQKISVKNFNRNR